MQRHGRGGEDQEEGQEYQLHWVEEHDAGGKHDVLATGWVHLKETLGFVARYNE